MLSFSYSEYNDEHPIPIVELFLENPNIINFDAPKLVFTISDYFD